MFDDGEIGRRMPSPYLYCCQLLRYLIVAICVLSYYTSLSLTGLNDKCYNKKTYTGTDLNIDKNKEVVNVCQAILEMKMEEREIGRSEGLNEGFTQAIINLMESLQCTAESAMDMLKIPNDSRQQLFERINNKHH